MRRHLTLRTIALAACASIAVALVFGGTARAITDTVFRYSPPKTGYLSLPPAAFTITDNTTPFSDDGVLIRPASATTAHFVAPVFLPNRATVKSLTAYYARGSASAMRLELWQQDLSTGGALAVLNEELPGTGGDHGQKTYALSSPTVIDNAHHSYFFTLAIGGNGSDNLQAVRVTYTYDNAGS